MKKGKGKNKGNAFERKVSLLLAEWWKVPKGTFWRSKISGGSNEPGDITPRVLDKDDKALHWPFVIECKHYKDVKFHQLLTASKLKDGGKILSWWQQLTKDQKSLPVIDPRIRLLIFRGNNTPIYVAFCPLDLNALAYTESLRIKDVLIYRTHKNMTVIPEVAYKNAAVICTWENFSLVMIKDLFINREEG